MKLGSELALQIDLAAAVIAVLALLFSIRAGMRQRLRISFLEEHARGSGAQGGAGR